MKKYNKLATFLIFVIALLCFAACGATEESNGGSGSGSESASEAGKTEESAPEVVVGKEIFWNTDYKEYLPYEGNTRTARELNDNIFYYVRVYLEDGTEADRVVQGIDNINCVDENRFFCLGETFYGVATKVQTVEEAGYKILAKNFYVSASDGTTVTLTSSKDLAGETVNVKITSDTKLVLLPNNDYKTAKSVTELIKYDRVYAIGDALGNAEVIYIAERVTSVNYCECCDAEVTWTDWTDTRKLPSESGHYRLTVDGQTTGQVSMGENVKICLDLNGHTFMGGEGKRIYSLHNKGTELAVMDHSESQNGCLKTVGSLKGLQGGGLWARYGILRIYSGTIDASASTNDFFGCTVCIESGAYGYMYGGKLIGGSTSAWYDTDKNTYRGGYGGTVCVNGTFEMTGGEIVGGSVYKLAGANSASDNGGVGGAVYVKGTCLIKGGTITGGTSDRFGGAIYNNGKLTISGGSVSGGKAYNGDNLYTATGATTVISGGHVYGGIYTEGKLECSDPQFIASK